MTEEKTSSSVWVLKWPSQLMAEPINHINSLWAGGSSTLKWKQHTSGEGGEQIVAPERACDANGEQRQRQILGDVRLSVDVPLPMGELHQVGKA